MNDFAAPTFESMVEFVLDKVAFQTKTPRENIHADTDLASVGVDSLNSVLLCGYLEDEYNLEIEPIMMFEYKTAEQVANAILGMMASR